MRRWDHKPWHPVWDARIFTLNEIHAIHPVRKAPVTYYALDSPDWVNVIPVTPENEVVLINQYRPGTDSICLEIPGGIVDSGENPHQTATRELTEETGYVAGTVEKIGVVEPNPAILNNRCHTFLARDCRLTSSTALEAEEHIEVVLKPLSELPGLVADGSIVHALVVAAFYHYFVTHAK